MILGNSFHLLFISCLCFLTLTGCSSNTSLILSNNESITKLNEMVKGRFVKVKTINADYEGKYLWARHDSTFINKSPGIRREIPNSTIQKIRYSKGPRGEDIIELKTGQLLTVNNVKRSDYGTFTTYDEILPDQFVFSTKDLVMIMSKKDQALLGAGIGLVAGAVTGLLTGYSLSEPGVKHEEFDPGPFYIVGGTCLGGGLGVVIGLIDGANTDRWKKIDVTVKFEDEP